MEPFTQHGRIQIRRLFFVNAIKLAFSGKSVQRGQASTRSCRYGDWGNFGIAGSKHVHCFALDVHISSIGRNVAVSSKVENRIEVKSGFDSPLVNNGLPQAPQKLRIVA